MRVFVVKDRHGYIVHGPTHREDALNKAAQLRFDYQTADYRVEEWVSY